VVSRREVSGPGVNVVVDVVADVVAVVSGAGAGTVETGVVAAEAIGFVGVGSVMGV